MFALNCPTRAYDWGSTAAIPEFQQRDNDGNPVAEVWIGTHPLGSAQLVGTDGERHPLAEVSGELGFMVKVLAAARPLSLQVHPDAERAKAGYAAEEAAGIPIEAPDRVYKDPYPKPEMVYALSTLDTLVGFRRTSEIVRVLGQLDHPLAMSLAKELLERSGFAGIVRLVERLTADPPTPEVVGEIVAECQRLHTAGLDVKRAYQTAVEIDQYHPGDVGVVVSLLLNRLTLQPGEAAYLGTGIIHAHLRGLCLEVMVSSDNVLRAGLTSKHVDPAGLVQCLDGGMARVARVTPEVYHHSTDIFRPAQEFALSVTQSSPADPQGVVLPGSRDRLLVCTGGEVTLVNTAGDALTLMRGDAAYAGESDGALRVLGTGEIAQGYVPHGETLARLLDLV